MALKATCPHCKKSFSAPEEYRGRKVACPGCGRRIPVQTEEEIQAKLLEEKEAERKKEADREKIALIERLESREKRRAGKPYYEEFQTGREAVRHYNPRGSARYARFRILSDFLVLGAYFELLLVCVGIGLGIYLRLSGFVTNGAVLLIVLVAWLVLGTVLFLLLKYLGELAFLLADVAEQQADVVGLLQDIRENTKPEPEEP
ncbi:MAG: hypothetical protein ACUVYA_15340 [Planctomycetota bacterium]